MISIISLMDSCPFHEDNKWVDPTFVMFHHTRSPFSEGFLMCLELLVFYIGGGKVKEWEASVGKHKDYCYTKSKICYWKARHFQWTFSRKFMFKNKILTPEWFWEGFQFCLLLTSLLLFKLLQPELVSKNHAIIMLLSSAVHITASAEHDGGDMTSPTWMSVTRNLCMVFFCLFF